MKISRAMAILVASVSGWIASGASRAQEVAAPKPHVGVLVTQLGDDRFAVRERATSQLIALGVAARRGLEEGIASPDREIRYRSRAVLAIIRDLDFQQRLADFAADSDASLNYGLPGWTRFRELVGDDRAAKPLFIGMVQAEPELMGIADDEPQRVGAALDRRCLELRKRVQLLGIRHSTDSVAALLFLVGDDKVALNRPTNSTLYFFCQQGDFQKAAVTSPARGALRKMLAAWLVREHNEPTRDAMMLGMQHEIRDVLPRARRTVRDAVTKPYDRLYAILAIAKFGDVADVPLLEARLDDVAVCTEFRRQNALVSVQIRDIALAALLHLAGEDFVEFAYPWLRHRQPFVFHLSTLGFQNDQQRQVALGKWRDSRVPTESRDAGVGESGELSGER